MRNTETSAIVARHVKLDQDVLFQALNHPG